MLNCPQCSHSSLVAEVQQRFIISFRCEHCGWSLPFSKIKKLNQIKAQSKPEFDREVQLLMEERNEE